MEQQQLPSKSPSRRCSEWVFRDVPSDVTIEVDGGTFSLHKFPLVSRSGRIRKIISERRRESGVSRIELPSLPGGAESFELAAQFCYGVKFEITCSNVARLLCVSDYLEMTEKYSKNNLSSRSEKHLASFVSRDPKMCVQVLHHCETLTPLADKLNIITRCIDSIASKACVEQITSSFSRLQYSSSGGHHMIKQINCGADWWIEDLSVLRVDLYQRVITAIKCRGVRPESIGASLVNFAQKELIKKKFDLANSDQERIVLDTIVGLLPVEKFAVPLNFLFGMLRSAVMLGCSVSCRLDLEWRIGSQLDKATLDDLLIPSFRRAGDTLFDVKTVRRILTNFSQMNVDTNAGDRDMNDEDTMFNASDSQSQMALCSVAKLVDCYLAEIAPDTNVRLRVFLDIAGALPRHARALHDGLYRAIDIYLKAHQGLSDPDKRKLCKLIDFQKLSQDAGAHAAQNERLPVQAIVQALFYEQQRLRNSLLCNSYPEDDPRRMHQQSWQINSGARSAAMSPQDNYASLRRENRDLKLELARMRMRLNDLEKDHACMKRNLDRSGSRKFMSSLSKKLVRLNIFGHSRSSRGSIPQSR